MILIERKMKYFQYFLSLLLIGFISLANADELVINNENNISNTDTTENHQPDAQSLLTEKSFKQKEKAIDLLAQSKDVEKSMLWLETMLKGKLYFHKQNKNIVLLDGKTIINADTNEVINDAVKKDYKKITVNNKLRKKLRVTIANMSLASPDPEIRLKAVNKLLDNITPDAAENLKTYAEKETVDEIKQMMLLGVSITNLSHGDKTQKLQAIESVKGSLNTTVRARLNELSKSNDKDVATAATEALQTIESKIRFYENLETLFFGLSLGSVLVLAAIGLAITFGVMGVINMAHGELIMLGAYTTFMVQQLLPYELIDYSLFIAVPAAFMVSGLTGILIERSIIRHLYGRPLETLLATFGVSLILQQLVRTFVSPQNVPVENPSWMSGTLEINSVLALTYNRLYIIIFSFMVFIALYYFLRNSALGLQVRAVSQNRQMARAMGVRSARVDALTFGLGSGIAGVAGVALSQLTNVGPNLGQSYIIDSFMVVVFGGVGNLWGTMVAGLSLGVINKVMEPWAGAVLAKILVLIFIILFIQKKPRGLFPQKGRAAGD
jgi:urea transport system permease protein